MSGSVGLDPLFTDEAGFVEAAISGLPFPVNGLQLNGLQLNGLQLNGLQFFTIVDQEW